MTALAAILRARIAATGPISVADYMAECLLHPSHGYYTTRDPLGAAGDFTTAPEISQMFGELLGLALAQTWLDQGSPASFTLAELGPGRGTLMADALRATGPVPGFHDAMNLVLVEASPTLRAAQQRALSGHGATWADSIHDLPDAPLFLIANEFFDALPIRQFIRTGNGWRERRVGLRDGELAFGAGDVHAVETLAHRLDDTVPGDLVETSASGAAIAAEIGARIAARGGVAIIVDYGDWRSLGDTLQAVKGHRPDDPLANPGGADLTAHVDFEALARAARPATATAMIPQGLLLDKLGIAARAAALAGSLSGAALQSHLAAYRRLTDAAEMGNLFKAIAITPDGAPLPPGFE